MPTMSAASVKGRMFAHRKWSYARIWMMVVAIVFLLAVVAKLDDSTGVERIMRWLGIPERLLFSGVLGLLALETVIVVLGAAGWNFRLFRWGVTVLLLLFSALLSVMACYPELGTCGCLGRFFSIEDGSKAAIFGIARNIGLGVMGWLPELTMLRRKDAPLNNSEFR